VASWVVTGQRGQAARRPTAGTPTVRRAGQRPTAPPRHRRSRSLFPDGRHRAPRDLLGLWGLPLAVAAVIVVTLTVLLLLTDVATAAGP
jgi:hypothetical protein